MMKLKPKKHVAAQLVMPVVDPPVRLNITLSLKGDMGRQWRNYAAAHEGLNPSNGQLVEYLMKLGLAAWSRAHTA